MNKLIPIIAISSLTLTACLEESDNENSAANNTNNAVQNPFAVASNDQQQVPAQQVPVQQVPVQQEPVQQEPVQQVPVSSDLQTAIINGASASTATSYWSCEEQTEVGAISIAFYANGSGEISDSIDSAEITWAFDGTYMDININADFYAQLSDFDLSTTGQNLELNYVVYDGTVGALSCDLITSSTSDPTNPPSVPGQTTAGSDNHNLLANTMSGGVLQDIWLCSASDGSNLALFLDNDGSGVLLSNSDYPDGITITWAINSQNIELVLADGNQVQIISPIISQNDFQADTVIVNGSSSGSLDCERITET